MNKPDAEKLARDITETVFQADVYTTKTAIANDILPLLANFQPQSVTVDAEACAEEIRQKLWARGYKIGYDAQGLREDFVNEIDREVIEIISRHFTPLVTVDVAACAEELAETEAIQNHSEGKFLDVKLVASIISRHLKPAPKPLPGDSQKEYAEFYPEMGGTPKPSATQEEWAKNLADIAMQHCKRHLAVTYKKEELERIILFKLSSLPAPQETPKVEGDVGEFISALRKVDTHGGHGELSQTDFDLVQKAADTIESLSDKLAIIEKKPSGPLVLELIDKLTKAEARVKELRGYLIFHKIDPDHPTIHTTELPNR